MSAFVVNTCLIDQIVSTLAYGNTSHDEVVAKYVSKYFDRALPDHHPMDKEDDAEFEQLARDLYSLNQDAVNYRYNNKPNGLSYSPDVSPFNVKPFIQTHKNVECLMYQCNEGRFDETDLYKSLSKFKDWLANQIVRDLEAWENAAWG